MPYGMTLPKNPPCSFFANGKHQWHWIKNGVKTSGSGGSLGGAVRITSKGIYQCECSKKKYGPVKHDAPGADLRDHVGPLS